MSDDGVVRKLIEHWKLKGQCIINIQIWELSEPENNKIIIDIYK